MPDPDLLRHNPRPLNRAVSALESMISRIRSVGLIVLFAGAQVVAQEEGDEVTRRSKQNRAAAEELKRELKEAGMRDPTLKALGRNNRPNQLRSFLAPMISTSPRRVAPGAAGQVKLVLAMQGDNVLLAGTGISLTYGRDQGPIGFGDWSIEAPRAGTLDTKLKGQLVYDNTALITVPFSVASDAKAGKVPINLTLETDVARGATGAVHGRYSMNVKHTVEVGRPLPTPVPREIASARGSAGATVDEAVESATNSTSSDDPQERSSSPVSNGPDRVDDAGQSVGASDQASTAPDLDSASASGDSFLLLVGAGGLVLVIVLLLLSRRK